MALLKKLIKGLSRTKQRFVEGLRSMLTGRKIDAALLEELESMLIQADIGVKTATRLVEDLTVASKDGRIEKGEEVLDFLKRELKS